MFKNNKYDRELVKAIIILKNLVIAKKDQQMKGDALIEEMAYNLNLLKSPLIRALRKYRNTGRSEEFESVGKTIGTEVGMSFSMILSRLDQLNPIELMTQLRGLEEVIKDRLMSGAMSSTDRKTLILTLVTTATAFVVMMNFTMIVVFMDAISIIENIF